MVSKAACESAPMLAPLRPLALDLGHLARARVSLEDAAGELLQLGVMHDLVELLGELLREALEDLPTRGSRQATTMH